MFRNGLNRMKISFGLQTNKMVGMDQSTLLYFSTFLCEHRIHFDFSTLKKKTNMTIRASIPVGRAKHALSNFFCAIIITFIHNQS